MRPSTMRPSTIVALLAVAIGVNAAPRADLSKRIDAIPLSICTELLM